MPKWLFASSILVALTACRSSASGAPARSERQRDSVIGASQLPGARGVQGALRLSDSAVTRQSKLDSAGAQ
jgi:hypothetical protein